MSNSLKGATADLLTSLDATSYTYPSSSYKSRLKANQKWKDDFSNDSLEEEPIDYLEIQKLSKKHYALDAEQLESLFPDLVYEQEDGTKVINYMELIPLLVQSIGELNERINKLSQQKDYGVQFARSASDIDEEKTVTSASLQQNTPNPFSSQTKIRFTLPDNTRNAYIYIFDMNGKMQKQIAIDSSMDSVTINGYELAAGIYLYSLVVNGQEIDTKRMILSK
ncbi:T9SS type A sorting domain-containing protein [Xylanibacter brevis]|uniref:T9SS type A sorting domain-containing protein n=1 Tax=Xylanibacter brevis TaxID=83231 RepID=UPI001E64375C|nr:T9SS type A sorting domain-containing protein [Xylanibacter brevis]